MAYFAPDQPQYNHLRHLQLVGVAEGNLPVPKDFAYQVAHMGTRGKPDAWFFDSFLVYTSSAPGGTSYFPDINLGTTACGRGDFFAVPVPNPAGVEEWRHALRINLARDGFAGCLEETVESLAPALGQPRHKRNVVVTIPYPHFTHTHFGSLKPGGPNLNFRALNQNLMRACEQRLEACRWFVDEAIALFRKGRFRNVNLLGFYWPFETMFYSWDVDDHWVVKELFRHVKERGSSLFWIPFFSTRNINTMSDSRELYFDCAFLQPNHMFYDHLDSVQPAADAARARGGGIELEYYVSIHPTVDIGEKKFERARNYLNGGVDHGYMTESACAYFIGFNDLARMARHKDPRERGMYDDFFHFVAGDYESK